MKSDGLNHSPRNRRKVITRMGVALRMGGVSQQSIRMVLDSIRNHHRWCDGCRFHARRNYLRSQYRRKQR